MNAYQSNIINEKSNTDRLCRFCLTEKLTMKKIKFNAIKLSEFGQLYEFVTKLELTECNKYSEHVCQDCATNIRLCAQQIRNFYRANKFWTGLVFVDRGGDRIEITQTKVHSNRSNQINDKSKTDRLCRFCLTEKLAMQKIQFNQIRTSEFGQLYEFVISMELEQSNKYSECVCDDCATSVRQCAQQIKKFRRADKFWKSLIFVNKNDKIEISQMKIEDNQNDIPTVLNDDIDKECNPNYVELSLSAVLSSNKKTQYQCSWCNAVFYCKFERRKHHKEFHTVTDTFEHTGDFVCNLCRLTFTKKPDILAHFLQHYPKLTQYICEQCGMVFKQRAAYFTHLLIHDVEWKCKDCDKLFKNNRELRAHAKRHLDEPTTCELCGKSVKNMYFLRTHVNSMHKRKPLNCPHCHKISYGVTALNMHLRKHTDERTFMCDICGLRCKSITSIRRHISVVHSENKVVGQRSRSAAFQLKCTMCVSTFGRAGLLKCHLRDVHGEVGIIAWEDNLSKIICSKCTIQFQCPDDLSEHNDMCHPKFECDICKRFFNSNEILQKHLTVHAGSMYRPYKCNICGAAYGRSKHLSTHILRIHTTERPFKCTLCDKEFAENFELISHNNFIHTQKKRFKCNYCDKEFVNPSSLRSHERKHTGTFQYSCEICFKEFRHGVNLVYHKNTKHKGNA